MPSTSYDPRVARDKRLREQFNISADEWDEVLRYQGGKCALCKVRNTQSGKNRGRPKPLNTDHDHKSGLTRGILCTGCNYRLKEFMTIEWLEAALDYMKNPPVTQVLGERYGKKGRVTNKRPRRSTKRTRRTKK